MSVQCVRCTLGLFTARCLHYVFPTLQSVVNPRSELKTLKDCLDHRGSSSRKMRRSRLSHPFSPKKHFTVPLESTVCSNPPTMVRFINVQATIGLVNYVHKIIKVPVNHWTYRTILGDQSIKDLLQFIGIFVAVLHFLLLPWKIHPNYGWKWHEPVINR
jgi:hypothetical protein